MMEYILLEEPLIISQRYCLMVFQLWTSQIPFNQKPVKKKVEVKEGRHLIQINLTNSPKKKIITNTYTADGGDKTKIRDCQVSCCW